jgi:RHS repeat-associated protein
MRISVSRLPVLLIRDITADLFPREKTSELKIRGGSERNRSMDDPDRYDLDGKPLIYAPDGTSRTASAFDIRHLFTGQQWYSDLGLYDLRNRFYSPDIGRFLQPDPIGFDGDATNLYRYAGNNPIKRTDPFGTYAVPDPGGWYTGVNRLDRQSGNVKRRRRSPRAWHCGRRSRRSC